MVKFVTAVKSVSYKGRRRKLRGKDLEQKSETIRSVMMHAVKKEPPVSPALPELSPFAKALRREINVTTPFKTSMKNLIYEMKTKMDFGGIFAPWSKIKE